MATPKHASDATPKQGICDWIEYRLPIFSFLRHSAEYRAPKNLSYMWNFGSLAGICLVMQIITGIVLAMQYTPHVSFAFDSVERIMRDVNYGWLLRYTHAVGASMFFAVVYIHILRGLYYGSYKAPRELIWWFGIVIFLLMMATAFMGYVLPWGQMSFWGATVITNLFSAVPLVGEHIVTWLWGGFSVDNPTLNRFFSLHYLLPFIIFALVALHVVALHIHGSSNPTGVEIKSNKDSIPFHPYYTVKDLFGFGIFFLVFMAFVFYYPNVLGHPDNYIPADPMVTPAHIVPEWYFLPFYAILRAIPNKLGGVVAMISAILILFVIPWLDRSPVRSSSYRPMYRIFFWLLVVTGLVLGYAGSQTPDWGTLIAFCKGDACQSIHAWLLVIPTGDASAYLPDITVARLATLYYFAHFLVVMPMVAKRETPKPLPVSISAAYK
ncbi:cytochrome b [bacterium]|nr:cytochrome b [bacterium]